MARAPREQNPSARTHQPPNWVIEHMITLYEYAEKNDLSDFEEKIVEATETLLGELNSRSQAAHEPLAPSAYANTNVVPFVVTTRIR